MEVKVNNEVLIWARTRMNMSQDVVAKRINKTPEEIDEWEKGKKYPTYIQLEELSYKVYKIPIAVFFFPDIPKNIRKEEKNFRTLNNEIYSEIPTNVIEMINNARVMQLNLKEIETRNVIRFTKLGLNIFDNELNEKIRDILGIDIEIQKKAKGNNDAFEMWRSSLYNNGIYVFKNAFKEANFSGFSLYDDEYPVIYINNSMSFTRQIFTLFHELYHIILKTNGIDKVEDDYIDKLEEEKRKIETMCNKFAGNFLVPDKIIQSEFEDQEINEKMVLKIANKYHVSREVIYRRLLDMKKISEKYYENIHKELNNEAYRPPQNNGGGNYYNTKKSYLGNEYIEDVCESYYKGNIDIYKVSDFLDVKVESIPNLGIMLKEGSR